MKICMVECGCDGSYGASLIADIASEYGCLVNYHDMSDVELVSIHHYDDFDLLANLEKKAPIRIVGGHPTYTNPNFALQYADAVCCGDGESSIRLLLNRISKREDFTKLHASNGIIVPSLLGENEEVKCNYERILNKSNPHLVTEGGFKHWCVEISRGCVYNCGYCEIGVAPYRLKSLSLINDELSRIDRGRSARIRLIAPEEMSHPDYIEIRKLILSYGLQHYSGGYRIENFLSSKSELISINKNEIIRVGIDGLSERLRFLANKMITDKMIIEFFDKTIKGGHSKFKVYQIIGYPTETKKDLDRWKVLMDRVRRISTSKNVVIDITWTPLIPQKTTKFDMKTPYPAIMANEIIKWHKSVRYPPGDKGVYINMTRLVPMRRHENTVLNAMYK